MAKPCRVEEVLKLSGPMLSVMLAEKLETRFGMTNSAARQAVSRAAAPVRRLKGIVFPHRARFVYLDTHYGSPLFFDALLRALREANHSCHYGLEALASRSGIMPVDHFRIACGAPNLQKKQVGIDRLIENLLACNLIKEISIPGIGSCLAMSSFYPEGQDAGYEIAALKARLVTETITLVAVRDWIRNLGLASYNKVSIRDESPALPHVGPNYWDLSAPSYLHPLATFNQKGELKPGSIVCDILLGRHIEEACIEPFLKKCLNVRGLGKIGPVMQMFVADSFDVKALRLLKGKGVIAATIDSLLGLEVAEALKQLTDTLTSTAKSAGNMEKLDALFKSLSKIEGAAGTLRGCLFEFVAAEIAREYLRPIELQMNQIVTSPSTGARAETDVFMQINRQEIIFIECKGHKPNGHVSEAEVEKWLDKRIPVLRDYIKGESGLRNRDISFALWTNASLTDASKARIAQAQAKTGKYKIEYKEGGDLLAMIKKTGAKALRKTYDEHFCNHPLDV